MYHHFCSCNDTVCVITLNVSSMYLIQRGVFPHPRHQKLAIAKTLLHRLDTHISDDDEKCKQRSLVSNTLALNGLPRKVTVFRNNVPQTPSPRNYIRGVSNKIQRILNKVGTKVAMRPLLTIGKNLLLAKMRFLV